MEGIPPARESDNEDVIWALETASTLWKRNARLDAVVWLRRAAEAAARGADQGRADFLTEAAEDLADTAALASTSGPTEASAEPATEGRTGHSGLPVADADEVDALLATGDYEEAEILDEDESEEVLELPIDTSPPSRLTRQTLPEVTLVPPPNAPLPWLTEAPPSPESETEIKIELASEGVTRMGADALSALDLHETPELDAATDAQRQRLVETSQVYLCMEGVELPPFAFARVLEGEVTITGAASGRTVALLREGSVVRTRGTFSGNVGAKFTATAHDTTVALWSEDSLAEALRGGPKVDHALRAGGDKLLAWASIAESPMGARLHEDVRLRLLERLSPMALVPDAELVVTGEPVPGILLVGAGSITVDGAMTVVISPGEFVFPDATLAAGRAKATARAGDDGAVVLRADRQTTQELWATEPLLLELLSS